MNLIKASSFNELVANILIEELYRNKIDRFFISPGSRSTALTSSVANNKKLNKHIHFDERGSAFAALGYARATNKPAVLICTSGSAGANYYPAICEASADSVPMIVITADRPPELHNVLANQTCDQQNMFGSQVRAFINIEPPNKNISLQKNLDIFSSTIQKALTNPSGPVHINFMFREPLAFTNKNNNYSLYTNEIQDWIKSDNPNTKIKFEKIKLPTIEFDITIPTIIIAGALKTKKESQAVLSFAENYNLPIFPDIRSGLRLSNLSSNLISHYDQILLTKMLQEKSSYQVIHVGGNIVSKRLHEFIEKSDIIKYVVLHNSIHPYNAHHKMTDSYFGDIKKLVSSLSENLFPFNDEFLTYLKNCNDKIKSLIINYDYKFTEILIARQISQLTTKNSYIYSANSLAIRFLDMFADISDKNNQVVSNRGLSGIDGTIASAVGYASGTKKRGTLLIGDLAFQHDINSLTLQKKSEYPLVIVLLNNNGGKIFSYLPIAKNTEIYQEYFETPQNLTFESTASQYDLQYYLITSAEQFKNIYLKAQKLNKSCIIEVALQDSQVFKEQKQLTKEIKKLD